MPETKSREIRLKSYPPAMPSAENFEFATATLPEPKDGEILVRNIFMSVDPYMRGRMRPARGYAEPYKVGEALYGGVVGKVVESKNKSFSKGDYVLGNQGWREAWLSNGAGVQKIDPGVAPIQSYLGVLGMPGLTAYVGLHRILEIKEGQTLFVSAASGAVGAIVCQIAKAKKCRVVGSAGSDEKVAWLLKEVGCDAAFNYKTTPDLTAQLAKDCPNGIDAYFENVGGKHLEAAMNNMKMHGRIAVCGLIDQYNNAGVTPGPSTFYQVIPRRIRIEGFLVFDHNDLHPQFLTEVGGWIKAGKIKWKETIHEGLDKAPDAFLGLFKGENFGKMLVRISAE